jgi:hypothetical protein
MNTVLEVKDLYKVFGKSKEDEIIVLKGINFGDYYNEISRVEKRYYIMNEWTQ